MDVLRLRGDVIERQTYLNGSTYYQCEGVAEPDDGWAWSLALTVPKAEGDAITEGDLSLSGMQGEWLADVAGGEHQITQDELTGAPLLAIRIELLRREDAEAALTWRNAHLELQIAADTTQGELSLRV